MHSLNTKSLPANQAERTPRRRVFALRFRAEPGNPNPVRSLRRLLKYALRHARLRCVDAVEVKDGE
jgi:hypothetical protein